MENSSSLFSTLLFLALASSSSAIAQNQDLRREDVVRQIKEAQDLLSSIELLRPDGLATLAQLNTPVGGINGVEVCGVFKDERRANAFYDDGASLLFPYFEEQCLNKRTQFADLGFQIDLFAKKLVVPSLEEDFVSDLERYSFDHTFNTVSATNSQGITKIFIVDESSKK